MAVALMAVALSKTDCDADGGGFTSAKLFDLEFDFSSIARFDGLFSTDFLPSEMSADTLVMLVMVMSDNTMVIIVMLVMRWWW